jgi:hypothetical protein
MPAAKYAEEAKYLLRMESTDKADFEAAARADRLTLADWINRELRASLRRLERRQTRQPA